MNVISHLSPLNGHMIKCYALFLKSTFHRSTLYLLSYYCNWKQVICSIRGATYYVLVHHYKIQKKNKDFIQHFSLFYSCTKKVMVSFQILCFVFNIEYLSQLFYFSKSKSKDSFLRMSRFQNFIKLIN